MKKFILVAFATLALAGAAMAQPRALGIRATYGAEVSYQHSINSNFIEADLGLLEMDSILPEYMTLSSLLRKASTSMQVQAHRLVSIP